ncbi:MAG: acetoin utilization protein AcuC [Armatimonadetes bacterium]|nr:acetoin utilization protein AcuC [Armatimonadota bacterium]
MAPKAAFIYSDRFAGYDLGPSHPLKPVRLRMTQDLLDAYGVLARPEARVVEARPATEEEVLAVHTRGYYDAVAALSAGGSIGWAQYDHGFGSSDNPPFPGMLDASLLYTGASLQAARLVSAGEVPRAFSISGGLHHAMPDRASGFCTFNDPAIAIVDLLRRHERVLYLDVDAHHGDGVQAVFYDSPRVLTISLHESGRTLFPGTGFIEETGTGAGEGYSVNIPLFPGTTDETYERVFEALVPPLVEWFDPQVVVAQLGVDTHALDPLTHLALSTEGFTSVVRAVRDWSRPLVALGGGGYNVDVVARSWTLAFACLAEVDLPDETPAARPQGVGARLRDRAARLPKHADPTPAAQFAERTVSAVREKVFRRHGIA